ncbi:DUF2855 family protein [Piscinibacter sp.]|uniref:DUF2855 family protein n=1 Tax=Piscinibacter sp. TaxID=1903157 RepID=UPI002C58EC8D|nr:DUF2855 family protein [Albitalea sp.]HUG25465.1 DUF2855 family protein [Albitalea sp.]
MNAQPWRFVVDRRGLRSTRCIADPDAPAARPLADGEARLAVEQFALTANNITYAAFGDAMQYWQFFPSGDAGFGCVPVWGFARVVESRCEGVEPGRRVYGYLPMGTHLVVQPARVRPRGFVDGVAHRAPLAAAYNEYLDVEHDPMHLAGREGLQSLLRPLFTTSFLLADHLAESAFHGATRVLVSSASSKTAWGTAFCAAQTAGPVIVGLTSRRNLAYVRALGCYGEVLAYDELQTLPVDRPSVYVDFSGDAALREAVHRHLGDALRHDAVIGGSHWQALRPQADPALPGPKPTFFFAPEQARRRAAEPPEGWGRQGLEQRLAAAWQAFVARVDEPGRRWLEVHALRGPEALTAAFASLRDGRVEPQLGLVVDARGR